MDFIDDNLLAYAEEHTTEESNLLKALNRETYANVLIPRMLSGHMQGRILSMISKMIRPKVVLEIGTYTGYSALCLSEGLDPAGKLITIDVNEELEEMVTRYFSQSKKADQFDFKIGDATQIIPQIDATFDLVFIDADKENYSNYFDLVIDKLSKGGVIIADNVLWSGKVLQEVVDGKDLETKSLQEFNAKISSDDRVENVLLPVRDGLMIIRKK
ncbi:MAG: caffeoyl-CoA O-methyltransferase [Bacteroidia bacterium]|jgi:caffeoyl-CoA O-methyltransferase